MIVPIMTFDPYQPFDLNSFLKVTAAVSIFTWSKFKSQINLTLLSGSVTFIHVLLTH